MVEISFNDGIASPHGRHKVGHLAGILDSLRRLDTTADVDGVGTNGFNRASRVVYAQATT